MNCDAGAHVCGLLHVEDSGVWRGRRGEGSEGAGLITENSGGAGGGCEHTQQEERWSNTDPSMTHLHLQTYRPFKAEMLN